jgi:hypothetical protein
VDQCGPYEYTVVGSGSAAGVQVDVDGIDFALGLFVDAKHVGKPAQGPYIRGSGDPPGRVRDLILDTTRSEVRRMGLILVDGRCPLVGVEIRVNDPGAVLTFEAILQESGVPGRVVVAK